MEVVGSGIDGSRDMVRKEQEPARDVSAFLAVTLRILSLVAAGMTFYGVYEFRSGSASSALSGLDAFFTWVYLIGGLLVALVLFAAGHLFSMLISVVDRRELAALGILPDVTSAQSSDFRELPDRATWQQGRWPSGTPTAVETTPTPREKATSHVPTAAGPEESLSDAHERLVPSTTQFDPKSPIDSRVSLWGAGGNDQGAPLVQEGCYVTRARSETYAPSQIMRGRLTFTIAQ